MDFRFRTSCTQCSLSGKWKLGDLGTSEIDVDGLWTFEGRFLGLPCDDTGTARWRVTELPRRAWRLRLERSSRLASEHCDRGWLKDKSVTLDVANSRRAARRVSETEVANGSRSPASGLHCRGLTDLVHDHVWRTTRPLRRN